jgi:glucuronate isomerase
MKNELTNSLFAALCEIPLIDPHSHIEPLSPASRTLDDILGYHYYTELAHSAGMSQEPLGKNVSPRDRVRAILGHMDRFDQTEQYSWFLEIAREFLGFTGTHVTAADADALYDKAEKTFAQPDWEKQVFAKTKLEAIFLTNEFDDPLEGFDTARYVPCLRTDTLVFRLHDPEVRERLARVTGIEVGDAASLRKALHNLFKKFVSRNAKACAISLPPFFAPLPVEMSEIDGAFQTIGREGIGRTLSEAVQQMRAAVGAASPGAETTRQALSHGVFWMLAELCREFKLPFDLMIGVNRRVYENGVFQGQDLFDGRTTLLHYRHLFNAFPDVVFPVSVLSSNLNQELVSHSWIFPNVITCGHWWYSNIPAYIKPDLTARLQGVPKTKQVGYYSDAYKLEFVLPKFNMYRRVLAQVLAEQYVESGRMKEAEAINLGRRVLRDNVREIFKI